LDSGAENRMSRTDFEQMAYSVFTSYEFDSQFYIDAIIASASNEYELKRGVVIGDIGGAINGETTASETNFALSSGYTVTDDNMDLRFSLLMNYSQLDIDGYTETTNSTVATARMDARKIDQLYANLGVDMSLNIATSFGIVIPQVGVGWQNHFSGLELDISGSLLSNGTSTDFSYQTEEEDGQYLTWRIGLSTVLKNGLTSYLVFDGYSGRRGYESNSASLGVRLEF
jgi:outer membrane autotransporter protein